MKKAQSVDQFSEGAIWCRSFGHAWKPYTAPYDKRARGYNVTLICNNGCDTFKHFTLSQRGKYGSPHYTYGDNYLAEFKVDSHDREVMRVEALSDVLGPASPVTQIKKNGTK
jgi:hypothetical protein